MVTDGPNLSTLQDTETASLAYFSGKSEMGSACRDGHQMPTLKVTVMGTNCQFFRLQWWASPANPKGNSDGHQLPTLKVTVMGTNYHLLKGLPDN